MRYRCPACRTRRTGLAYLVQHQAETGHTWCLCGGPPWSAALGKHRPGTYGCQQRDELQRAADHAWQAPGEPFTDWPHA